MESANPASRFAVFKLCTTVALVLSLALTVAAVFAIWNFSNYNQNNNAVDHA